MKMRTADIFVSVLLLIMCVLGFVETTKFTQSAAMLPRITFGCIAVLSLIQLIKVLPKKESKTVSFSWPRVLKIMGLSVAYVLLLPVLGYYIDTILYIVATMFFFRVRNKWVLICVPVGFVIFVYFIFVRVLGLNPPSPFFM